MTTHEDPFVREPHDNAQYGVWVRDRVGAVVASYNDLRARLGPPTFDARRAAVRGDGSITTAWTLREQTTGHVLRLQDAAIETTPGARELAEETGVLPTRTCGIEPDDFAVAWRIASTDEPAAERLYRWLRGELEPIKMTARLAVLNPREEP